MKISRVILHPIFVGSLLLLLLNDFVLKVYYPSIVTGKLSDVTGLFVLPIFIYSIFPFYFKSPVRKVCLLVAVAIFFGTLQSEGFLNTFNQALQAFSLPAHNLTADLSDLWSLFVLVLVFKFLVQFEKNETKKTIQNDIVWVRIVFAISIFSLVATSFTGTNILITNDSISHKSDRKYVIEILHKELAGNGYEVTRNTIIKDSTQLIAFKLWTEDSINPNNTMPEYYMAELYLEKNATVDSIIVSKFKLSQYNRKISDKIIDSIYVTQISPIIKHVQTVFN